MEVPFNLDNLRKHLAQVQLARRVLPEDITARQTLLEASVHEVASERFKHEDAIFKQLGMGVGSGLQERNLQAWMWTWHVKLSEKLEETIKDIVKAEEQPKSRPFPFIHNELCLMSMVGYREGLSPRAVFVTCESQQAVPHHHP